MTRDTTDTTSTPRKKGLAYVQSLKSDPLVMNPLTRFKWDERREGFAHELALGKLSVALARAKHRVGFSEHTRWLSHPEFAARIKEEKEAFKEQVRDRYFAIREGRADSLMLRLAEIEEIWVSRAKSFKEQELEESGGGQTGHIVREYKSIGAGPLAYKVTEYKADVALIREYRALQEQIARELGQWGEKLEINGLDKPLVVREILVQLASREIPEAIEADYRETENREAGSETQETLG